ncbi:TPA: hypothetical protein HA278_07845 [Candidatus Woesearchaeota archaeon]|nr:hypothetical protein [Candidatus Woesearchaeota archaeon]
MKNLRRVIRHLLLETIPLDIKVGDVILTGRFKNRRSVVKSIGTDEYGQPTINGKSILKFKIEKNLAREKWSAKSRKKAPGQHKVRGYIKPVDAFKTLGEWEELVETLLDYQDKEIDTRGGEVPEEIQSLVDQFFGFQLDTEVNRYDQLSHSQMMNFIEDFVNHRFWSFRRQFEGYFPDIDSLKFAYFYSRGDIEPYVLLDDHWTSQIYGSTQNLKTVKHYTSEEGLQNLKQAITTNQQFDISCFTDARKQYFDPNSSLVVTLEGNVRAAFRSDVKSFATDSGRRAMNMYRLDYPGDDLTNICYDLDDCEPDRTSLWNELIVTPIRIIKVEQQ